MKCCNGVIKETNTECAENAFLWGASLRWIYLGYVRLLNWIYTQKIKGEYSR